MCACYYTKGNLIIIIIIIINVYIYTGELVFFSRVFNFRPAGVEFMDKLVIDHMIDTTPSAPTPPVVNNNNPTPAPKAGNDNLKSQEKEKESGSRDSSTEVCDINGVCGAKETVSEPISGANETGGKQKQSWVGVATVVVGLVAVGIGALMWSKRSNDSR